jgi:hypothetical protein
MITTHSNQALEANADSASLRRHRSASRSPVTASDSDREAPQRREGRREDERGMVEISGQRSEPVAIRRRQDGPRILPSALIPSRRCSLWGVRAALGYGLDQKATLETNADFASLRRHRSALRSPKGVLQ